MDYYCPRDPFAFWWKEDTRIDAWPFGKGVKSFKDGVNEAKEEINKAKDEIDEPAKTTDKDKK